MIAGGVESISAGTRQTPGKSQQHPTILEKSPDIFMAMGNTAEVVARRYNVSREYQDEFSLESQKRTAAASKQVSSRMKLSRCKPSGKKSSTRKPGDRDRRWRL